ncbi:hypothetical protein DdX_11801 [Ditylenchus destructor]|uniref:Uncharacterized protein n=1 Tax=Ditylenchus destructor TaxID=166010 RepID=A0AAD4MZW8_9BILA|nr:hypothetical protein DdX_11801 [Ditylenchus destructor]
MPKRQHGHTWSSSDCSESDASDPFSVSCSKSRKRSRIHVKKSRRDDRSSSSSSDDDDSSHISTSSSSSSGSERSSRKRIRSKRKLRKVISREVEKQLRRRERSCSVVSSRAANRKERSCSVVSNRAMKISRSPSVEILFENVDNSLPNATRNTSSGYDSRSFTDWDQWDQPSPSENPQTNRASSSSGHMTISEFFLREEQNPGPSNAMSNTRNVYLLDYLCEAFQCGFMNRAGNLDRVFRENLPVVQQLLIGAMAKVRKHNYSIYFKIADVVILDAATDKVLKQSGKQQFGHKQRYEKWPYLVKNKDDFTEGCFPVEIAYLLKD